MNFPKDLLGCFARAEAAIKSASWYREGWMCCSGLWQTVRYEDTVVLRLTKEAWSSVREASLYEGGEIQYAAWVDPKLLRKGELRFEMHIFGFIGAGSRKISKSDFTEVFRERAGRQILEFGHHDMKRGPAVPYAGSYCFASADDLVAFLVADFERFVTLAPLVDERLGELLSGGSMA